MCLLVVSSGAAWLFRGWVAARQCRSKWLTPLPPALWTGRLDRRQTLRNHTPAFTQRVAPGVAINLQLRSAWRTPPPAPLP